MEQFPKKQETEKKSNLGKNIMGGLSAAAALGGMAKIGMNPEMSPTYEALSQPEPPKAEQPASESDLAHTDIPQGFTLKPEQSPKEVLEIIVQKPGPDTLRPELRPEEWKSLSHYEDPLLLLDYVVSNEALRLGVDPLALQAYLGNWMSLVVDAESDWDQYAENPISSAKSFNQFLTADQTPGKQDGSVHTAINRMYDLLERQHFIDAQPGHPAMAWADDLYLNPDLVTETPLINQQLVVFANVIQQPGSDELLRKLTDEDPSVRQQAAKDLYYRYHHTNPDEGTIANLERDIENYFPLPENSDEISDIVLAQN